MSDAKTSTPQRTLKCPPCRRSWLGEIGDHPSSQGRFLYIKCQVTHLDGSIEIKETRAIDCPQKDFEATIMVPSNSSVKLLEAKWGIAYGVHGNLHCEPRWQTPTVDVSYLVRQYIDYQYQDDTPVALSVDDLLDINAVSEPKHSSVVEDLLDIFSTTTSSVEPKSEPIPLAPKKKRVKGKKKKGKKETEKKKKIPAAVRMKAWTLHIGASVGETKCPCCKTQSISPFNFHCGHIVAEANGGETIAENLMPICATCNLSMGTRNLHEFRTTHFA